MFFDFRRGADHWPSNVELISPEAGEAEIQRIKDNAAKETGGGAKKVNTSSISGGPGAKKMEGFGSSGMSYDVMYPANFRAMDSDSSSSEEEDAQGTLPGAPELDVSTPAPKSACWEELRDGSSALAMQPGWRLKLNLGDLLKGGDAKKDERERAAARKEREAAQRKKRAAKRNAGGAGGYSGAGGSSYGAASYGSAWAMEDLWGADDDNLGQKPGVGGTGYGGYGGVGSGANKLFRDTMGEWTVTMDLKLEGPPPREGLSLLHTALLHAEDTKGRKKLKPSEGEAVVNCDGGVGQLGTFGDTAVASLVPGKWQRVVVAVKVAAAGGTEKGDLRTWVDTAPGCVLKSEAIAVGGRFEVDLDGLFLFSSSDPAMMPGHVSLRTVRVERSFATDKTVLANRAKDRVLSMLNEELKRKVDAQRRGLSLAALFAKPRPIWATPTLVATFGDAFIEGTGFEGSSCLAWSFQVLNHGLQACLRNPAVADTYLGYESCPAPLKLFIFLYLPRVKLIFSFSLQVPECFCTRIGRRCAAHLLQVRGYLQAHGKTFEEPERCSTHGFLAPHQKARGESRCWRHADVALDCGRL
jgi:hypothetical protein